MVNCKLLEGVRLAVVSPAFCLLGENEEVGRERSAGKIRG